ncbi:long-chain-fatty-acid--CoA ligase [Nonomuraea sp. NPDC005650]|uniref:long-chain-fatty-acid--CoA ligase n=1 Tax=Nonomuraea sp. NPDC005650 TaxID=3157045 RepID=UPI0033A047B8
MDYQLTIDAILRRAERFSPGREIVTRLPDRSYHRLGYADLAQRARRLGSALTVLGLPPGARVATLCWSHHQHAEIYFGAPIAGLVTHPINPRLHPDDIAFIATHACDAVLIVDESLLDVYEQIRDRVSFEHVVVIGNPPTGAIGYEELLATGDNDWRPPEPDERTTALVTYTSGTTGRPKGVEVSHRAVALHSLSSALPGWLGFTDADTVMPVVPMFHALAWGWPYTCALLGTKLVLPGPLLDPVSLLENIEQERVTVTGGVPTIWTSVLQTLDADPGRFDVSSLRAVLSGGSTAPPSMIASYQERYGVALVHTWGMTELTMGAISALPWGMIDAPPDRQSRQRAKQGRPMPFIEIRARGDAGLVPWDDQAMGELEVRGPWVAAEYADNPEASTERWTDDGWLRTGDIVTIDEHGYIDIRDRAKDLIKSGGEWISTPALENALMGHPAVAEAAVIAVPDARWSERPLAVVALRHDANATSAELLEFIAPAVAKWWLPDRIEIIEAIPKTAVGKFDKIALRRRYSASEGHR